MKVPKRLIQAAIVLAMCLLANAAYAEEEEEDGGLGGCSFCSTTCMNWWEGFCAAAQCKQYTDCSEVSCKGVSGKMYDYRVTC
jgi:hypothetical protein